VEKLYKAWRDYDIEFFYVYTREPHPGFYEKQQTKDLKERKANAKQCQKELGMTLPWIIDDMKSSIQRAYGGLPNSAYIIGSNGKVFYKEAWADASNLDKKLKEMYKSDPKLKTNAVKYLEGNILSEKKAERRAELMVKLSRIDCEDARKVLGRILKKEKETDVKTELIKSLTNTSQKQYIEFLIETLEDTEEDVRSVTLKTLKELTGKTFDFDAAAEEAERSKSIVKWKSWWGENKDRLVWSEELERFEAKKEK